MNWHDAPNILCKHHLCKMTNENGIIVSILHIMHNYGYGGT